MPAGHASWIRRTMGLALSRHLLRRSLALQGAPGNAVLATILSAPVREDAGTTVRMQAPTFQRWAAMLSRPSVELLVRDDHVAVEQDGELIASGSLDG